MLNTTDKFRELATAGGRQPFCVIRAGEKTFLDDSIKSFQFQEVIFPEELTFGAACSGRFHFELETAENIPLSAEIRPYIGFGEYSEDAELCPLGVFCISKRYRRRNSYSVTCYDRMYRLEDKYKSELAFPTTSDKLLEEICEKYGLEFQGDAGINSCEKMPADESVRNILGYLAGLEGACAVFDRYGRLCFRKMTDSGFRITRSNYASLDLKQDPMTVEKIEIDNGGDEVIEEGEGTKLGTYRIYDPFASQHTAKKLYTMYGGFTYYGLELDMQGLPFLEAGDIITVQNDCDDGLFTAVIGELNFTYNGSFWLTLSSKSKNPVQDSEDAETQEQQLQQMAKSLSTVYYNYRSDRDVTVGENLTSVAQVDLEVLEETSAVLAAQLVAEPKSDCLLTLSYTVEDLETPPEITASLKEGEHFPICLHNFFSAIPAGYITVRIYAKAQGGTVLFRKGKIVATVSGQHLAENALNRSPNRTIYQSFAPFVIQAPNFKFPMQEHLLPSTQIPMGITLKESITVQMNGCGFNFGISDSLIVPKSVQKAEIYSQDNVMYARLTFFNPISTQDAALLAPAFKILAIFTEEQEEHGVTDVVWDGNTEMVLTVDGMFVGASQIRVLYESAKGDMTDGFSGEKLDDFDITAEAGKENIV